jgi:hypothetical protein
MNKNKYNKKEPLDAGPSPGACATLGSLAFIITALSANVGDVVKTSTVANDQGSNDVVKIDHHPHIHSDIVIDRRRDSSHYGEENNNNDSDKSRENWAIYDAA